MLGATHVDAVRALRNTGDRLLLIVCEGYDADAASSINSNVIANPLVTSDMTKQLFQTSSESISSIDREASTDVSFQLGYYIDITQEKFQYQGLDMCMTFRAYTLYNSH